MPQLSLFNKASTCEGGRGTGEGWRKWRRGMEKDGARRSEIEGDGERRTLPVKPKPFGLAGNGRPTAKETAFVLRKKQQRDFGTRNSGVSEPETARFHNTKESGFGSLFHIEWSVPPPQAPHHPARPPPHSPLFQAPHRPHPALHPPDPALPACCVRGRPPCRTLDPTSGLRDGPCRVLRACLVRVGVGSGLTR